MRKTFFFILVFAFSYTAKAQTVVKGNNPTYAGDTLKLYIQTNPITDSRKLLAKTPVNGEGNFMFEFNTFETQLTYIDLDVFIGRLYVIPDSTFEISIPNKQIRAKEDYVNPYFRPTEFYVGILNSDSLNYEIRTFDLLYDKAIKTIFSTYNGRVDIVKTETEIKKNNDSLSNYSNPFYLDYKNYRLARLKYLTYMREPDKIYEPFFENRPFLIKNLGYTEAVSTIFTDYIFKVKGLNAGELLNKKISWKEFNAKVKQKSILKNDTLREYVILENLYQKFYSNKQLQNHILEMVLSAKQQSKIIRHQLIAHEILKKSGKLVEGNPAPDFKLPDIEYESKGLAQFYGNFVYLSFCSPESYPCFSDLKVLQGIHNKNIEKLKIVTIWNGLSVEEMKRFSRKYNYDWTFLFCDNYSQVLKDYNINVFPTYFLIDPEGNISRLNTKAPSNGFEQVYFDVYMKYKQEQINNKKNENNNSSKDND